jgi:hypothetical protein
MRQRYGDLWGDPIHRVGWIGEAHHRRSPRGRRSMGQPLGLVAGRLRPLAVPRQGPGPNGQQSASRGEKDQPRPERQQRAGGKPPFQDRLGGPVRVVVNRDGRTRSVLVDPGLRARWAARRNGAELDPAGNVRPVSDGIAVFDIRAIGVGVVGTAAASVDPDLGAQDPPRRRRPGGAPDCLVDDPEPPSRAQQAGECEDNSEIPGRSRIRCRLHDRPRQLAGVSRTIPRPPDRFRPPGAAPPAPVRIGAMVGEDQWHGNWIISAACRLLNGSCTDIAGSDYSPGIPREPRRLGGASSVTPSESLWRRNEGNTPHFATSPGAVATRRMTGTGHRGLHPGSPRAARPKWAADRTHSNRGPQARPTPSGRPPAMARRGWGGSPYRRDTPSSRRIPRNAPGDVPSAFGNGGTRALCLLSPSVLAPPAGSQALATEPTGAIRHGSWLSLDRLGPPNRELRRSARSVNSLHSSAPDYQNTTEQGQRDSEPPKDRLKPVR